MLASTLREHVVYPTSTPSAMVVAAGIDRSGCRGEGRRPRFISLPLSLYLAPFLAFRGYCTFLAPREIPRG